MATFVLRCLLGLQEHCDPIDSHTEPRDYARKPKRKVLDDSIGDTFVLVCREYVALQANKKENTSQRLTTKVERPTVSSDCRLQRTVGPFR